MENLRSRVTDFYNSLGEFKAESMPSWTMGPPFTALIEAAQKELPEDPVIQAIEPTTQLGVGCNADAGSMRTMLDQIRSALGETAPLVG